MTFCFKLEDVATVGETYGLSAAMQTHETRLWVGILDMIASASVPGTYTTVSGTNFYPEKLRHHCIHHKTGHIHLCGASPKEMYLSNTAQL